MTTATHEETLGFQTEVKQLLNLMIHSLYSNREIFLRELISNAADACDKLRYQALDNDALYEGDSELRVEIEHDSEAGTVTLRDNGIGMNREDVIANLGTIAKSGTAEFLKQRVKGAVAHMSCYKSVLLETLFSNQKTRADSKNFISI